MDNMLRISIGALACVLATSLVAGDERIAYDGDNVYTFQLSESDYEGNPQWDPRGDPAPLAVSNAVQISESWIQKYAPHLRTWHLSEIKYDNFREPNGKSHYWMYSVVFSKGWHPQRDFQVIVLMDGSVPEVRKVTGDQYQLMRDQSGRNMPVLAPKETRLPGAPKAEPNAPANGATPRR